MGSYNRINDIQTLLDAGMTVDQIKTESEQAGVDRLYIYIDRDGNLDEGELQNRRSEAAWDKWYAQKSATITRTADATAPAEELATTRQIAYATHLMEDGRRIEGQPTDWDGVAALSKREASALIEQLMDTPAPAEAEAEAEAEADEVEAPATEETTEDEVIEATVTLRTDLIPDEPSTEGWEPLVRQALAESTDNGLHASIETDAITIDLHHCAYPDGTPIWDQPLVGHGGRIHAVRRDGQQLDILTEDGHTWDDLAARLDSFMEGWGQSVMVSLSELDTVERQIVDLESKLRSLKAARKRQARAAHTAGAKPWTIHKLVGRPIQTVQRWLN